MSHKHEFFLFKKYKRCQRNLKIVVSGVIFEYKNTHSSSLGSNFCCIVLHLKMYLVKNFKRNNQADCKNQYNLV